MSESSVRTIENQPCRNGDFDYQPVTRVAFGAGSLSRLGSFVQELGGRTVLVVTDPHLVSAGHVERATDSLGSAGVEFVVYDRAEENPTTRNVDDCVQFARPRGIDLIVGLGGGSAMDCAKGTNFIISNGGRMHDYWGVGKAPKPMLPMIAIPTTAGTGSEAQSFALIADATTHMKMACGDKKAAARVAILDPELTVTMPQSVTAATGIDAISHALETYVTNRRNALSQIFSREAWRLLNANFETVLSEPTNVAARGEMLVGAHLAGAAIENSMLGATHACANPLTAHLGVAHGVAIGVMLPHILRWNAAAIDNDYVELVRTAALDGGRYGTAAECLAVRVAQLVERSGQPTRLRDCGLDPNLIPVLADEATQQWTGRFNPRPLEIRDFMELYQCAF